MDLGLVPLVASGDLSVALVAVYRVLPVDVVLAQLVPQRQPALSEVVVPREELYLLGSRDEEVDESVNLIRLLRLLSDLSHNQIVGDLRLELNVLVGRALVPHQAGLAGVEEVEAVGNVDLLVLGLDPGQLVHHLVAPLVHALVANMHLGVEDPEEAEAFPGERFNRDVHDLGIGHS